jgi:hypothetical protein
MNDIDQRKKKKKETQTKQIGELSEKGDMRSTSSGEQI